jgi:hypothetical protein
MNETLEHLEMAILFNRKALRTYLEAGEPDGRTTTSNLQTAISYLTQAQQSLLHP